MTITTEQLEAIRKRAEAAKDFDIFGDIPKLLAEIDRLRNELSEAREYNEYYFDLAKERKRENERLGAELGRARSTLEMTAPFLLGGDSG